MLSFQQREDDVDYHMMLTLTSFSKIKAILNRKTKWAQNDSFFSISSSIATNMITSSWEVVSMMTVMIVVVLTIEIMMGSYKY